jgi:LmbE family N-acetylglucosaminyl deacetylase
MLRLQLAHPQTILCIGAHCDDIEIGCAGTLLELCRRHPAARFHWAVFSGDPQREAETRAAAARLLGASGQHTVEVGRFRDSCFPYCGADIKEHFEDLKRRVEPDLIFTHDLADRHQDHRLLAELTWNTFRHHAVLEYEIPKYEGDLGHPNVFVPLDAAGLDQKIGCLLECFQSQRGRSWFTADTFRALARLRGIECGAPGGFAEAFNGRKLCL